jgi:diguanylate cyclase (GGDEF)-like protein
MIDSDLQKNLPLILVVGNPKTLRVDLREAIDKEGYRIAEALTGEQGLNACQQLQPELVLLDTTMPDIDGFSCCAKLQALLGDHCPPILMIIDLGDQASVELAFEVGAADYVTRPIHWAVLRQRVPRLIQANWAMKELRQQVERENLLKEQLKRAEQKLESLTSVDTLTGIANRRCFDEYLHREWKRAARERKPLSLILSDIDFFKAYNNTYGTQAGDECLKQIARTIRQVVRRPADLVARYSGEEFAVLLPNTPARGGVQVAEAMRSQVKALAIANSGSQVSHLVTISLGVASAIPSSESSIDRLIDEAKEALDQAKIGLRDRVVFHMGNLSVNSTDLNPSTPLIWEGNVAEFYETS